MRSTILALLLLLTMTAQAETALEAAENWLPPRPDINTYIDEAAFVSDVLAWEQKRQHIAQRIESGQLPASPHSPSSEEHDWHHVTGPEDLETALQNAHGYEQPEYPEKLRFNRTTHLSFPLQHLEKEQLAEKRVPTPEADSVSTAVPLVMVDEGGHLVLAPGLEGPHTTNPGTEISTR